LDNLAGLALFITSDQDNLIARLNMQFCRHDG
jgi:hypothetical protein